MYALGWIVDLRLVVLSLCIIVAALGCCGLFGAYVSIKIYHEKKAELGLCIFGLMLGLIISLLAFYGVVLVFIPIFIK